MKAYQVECWYFHWKFWAPKQCHHDKVYIGWWAWVSGEGRNLDLSAKEVQSKVNMGILEA
jgi:hypothetical protein